MEADELAGLLRQRRTINFFKSSPTPDLSLIKSAVELASWAPNHHLTQPWHFYLLGQRAIERMCSLHQDLMTLKVNGSVAEKQYHLWRKRPGWLLVSCRYSEDNRAYMEDYAACCCAVQNMMLYLWDSGVGMKWSTSAIINDERCYQIINADPSAERIIGLFWYGYPEEIPQMQRQPVALIYSELE